MSSVLEKTCILPNWFRTRQTWSRSTWIWNTYVKHLPNGCRLDSLWFPFRRLLGYCMEFKTNPDGSQNVSRWNSKRIPALKADIKRNLEKMQKWNDPLISKGQRGKAIAIFEIQGPAIACPWAGIRSSDIRNPTSEIVAFFRFYSCLSYEIALFCVSKSA